MPTENKDAVTATLIRGNFHDVMGLVFDRNAGRVTLPITPEQEAYLRSHNSHDEIELTPGEMRSRPRFTFSNDAPAPAPETRRRVEARG